MKTLTLDDIPHSEGEIDLGDGLTLKIQLPSDETMHEPWTHSEGHGPVSEWTTRDKHSGERLLCSSNGFLRFYNFAEAMKLAKRDGWGLAPEELAKLESARRRKLTKGEICVVAVERDFKYLSDWCNDRWQYVGVIVTITHVFRGQIGEESVWGVESFGDFWREVAFELVGEIFHAESVRQAKTVIFAEELAVKATKETAEREHWEARDTVTI